MYCPCLSVVPCACALQREKRWKQNANRACSLLCSSVQEHGQLQFKQKQYEASLETLTAATQLSLRLAAHGLSGASNAPDASPVAVALGPQDMGTAFRFRGNALGLLGRFAEAVMDYGIAFALWPRHFGVSQPQTLNPKP